MAFNLAVETENANEPNLMVLFGTGQFVASGDNLNSQTQHFYGVWDSGVSGLRPSNLVEQFAQDPEITVLGNSNIRVASDNPVTFNQLDTMGFGWKMQLPVSRERVVADPLILGDFLLFNTIVPGDDSDPCETNGSGYLMAVDVLTGGRIATTPPLDINDDDLFDENDQVLGELLADGEMVEKKFTVSSEFIDGQIPWQTSFLRPNIYTPTSAPKEDGSEIQRTEVNLDFLRLQGRLSWEELY